MNFNKATDFVMWELAMRLPTPLAVFPWRFFWSRASYRPAWVLMD